MQESLRLGLLATSELAMKKIAKVNRGFAVYTQLARGSGDMPPVNCFYHTNVCVTFWRLCIRKFHLNNYFVNGPITLDPKYKS